VLTEVIKNNKEYEYVRASAADALGQIGPAAQAAVPPLTEALKNQNEDICASAAYALGRIGSAAQAAVPALSEAFKDESKAPIFRLNAAMALQRIGSEEAVSVLIESEQVVFDLINSLRDIEVPGDELLTAIKKILQSIGKR
jgi:HEAT repeat protein